MLSHVNKKINIIRMNTALDNQGENEVGGGEMTARKLAPQSPYNKIINWVLPR